MPPPEDPEPPEIVRSVKIALTPESIRKTWKSVAGADIDGTGPGIINGDRRGGVCHFQRAEPGSTGQRDGLRSGKHVGGVEQDRVHESGRGHVQVGPGEGRSQRSLP